MYFNIKCIGRLPGPTNELERSLVFETGEFERPKFDCILDLFLTTNHTLVESVSIIPGLSDHDIVRCTVNSKPKVTKNSPRRTLLYRKADWASLKIYMRSFCDSFLSSYECKSVEVMRTEFKEA